MHRFFFLAAILAIISIGCGDQATTAPESVAGTGPTSNGKSWTTTRLSEVDNQVTHTDIFGGFRVVIFWKYVGGTWLWRVEIYRTGDGSYVQGSGWDTYGPDQNGVTTRVRNEFDHNGNNYPDGGEGGGGGVDNQG